MKLDEIYYLNSMDKDYALKGVQNLFNKKFGFLKDKNVIDEYVKVLLKTSDLSSNKRKLTIDYIKLRCEMDPKFKDMINELEIDIYNKLKSFETPL